MPPTNAPELGLTAWLERVKDGNEEEFSTIWEQYFTNLAWLARERAVNSPVRSADEEDIVQVP